MNLEPADQEKIKYLFQTTPFDKDDIEKGYKIFGFDLSDEFFTLVRELGISVEFALEAIDMYLEFNDADKKWFLRPDKKSYWKVIDKHLRERFS